MPEGHTLHRLALDLTDAFASTHPQVSSPQGRFADSAAIISGRLFAGAQAHGKHLMIDFEDHFLHIHLGLIGKFRLAPPAPPQGEIRVRIATPEIAADLSGPQLCILRTPEAAPSMRAMCLPDSTSCSCGVSDVFR